MASKQAGGRAGRGVGRGAPGSRRGGDGAALKLEALAQKVVEMARAQEDPAVQIPIRALSNVSFNEEKRHIEMGDAQQSRNFFNYGQAKRFMQTLLVGSKCKDLIASGKTASIRQIYYLSKHTIKGTNEKTFDDQSESDPVIEDLEVALDALREELHVFASNRGNLVGPITLVDAGSTLDCAAMGSAGYAVPSIVEADVVQFKKCQARFVLHVEKDTVWRRFHEDRFWEKHSCIVSHGGGQPARGMRRLLQRFHEELRLPVFVLLDNDPWGYYIYSVIKHGSINLAYESRRMAIPDAKFIGVSSFDYERCGLNDDVKIALDAGDVKRAKQIADYPWFANKRPWQKEIRKLLANGFKMEVEAMITRHLTYLTDEYVPMKLQDRKQWLD
ncbi:MAG TPA: DNA topoisomerase IV subunit A [Phycisphaerae bacterium]|nr:DNA topoisomerase IV subunit A [Phycisphaerae bacterium]HNU45622.1 DNA topoisomerase IV subunit A [Phycisphaerae bacterium]